MMLTHVQLARYWNQQPLFHKTSPWLVVPYSAFVQVIVPS